MERLTKRIGKTVGIGEPLRYYNYGDIKGILERLADIEDILGDDYDLDRLKSVWSVMHNDPAGETGEPGAIIPEEDIPYLRGLLNQRMTMREDVAERWKLTKDVSLDRLRELAEADRDGRCVVVPCKPGDDLRWHNAAEGTTRLIKNGVNGVVVFEDKFAILNYDSFKDEWSIIFLPEGDGVRKTEAKPQNQHFLQRFMEVK